MVQIGSTTPSTTAANETDRLQGASAVARYTRSHREQLGLTIDRAADLAGLELSQWCALEDGWLPEKLAVIRAIATTLQVRWSDYDLLTLFARCAQQHRS